MGRKRYALAWLKISGESAVSSCSIAPRWLNVTLGTAAVLAGTGSLLAAQKETDGHIALCVFGAVFVIAGILSLLFSASFALDAERREWREEVTIAGIGKVTQGSFDEAVGIQLVIWNIKDSLFYAVVWRWRDEQRWSRLLDVSRDYARAREQWVALGRELHMPLVEWREFGLVVVEPEAASSGRQAPASSRSISTLTIPDPPAGARVVVDHSPGRITLFMPTISLAMRLCIIGGAALIFEGIASFPAIALYLAGHPFHYQLLLVGAIPVGVIAILVMLLPVMTQMVIELRDEEIRLRRRFRLGVFRPRRIPYGDITGIHRAPALETKGLFVLVTTRRGYNLGQGLNRDGRDWLVNVLQLAMGKPKSPSARGECP